ncbi:MAG TPA: hypothetical protein VLW85_20235 [Myxococcales bacterium]|nr:hypothetical protein [Myxococcales bacterium]
MADLGRDPVAIRAGIERARQEIEQSMQDLRASVSQSLNWRRYVRRHPAACFCGAMACGLMFARITSR